MKKLLALFFALSIGGAQAQVGLTGPGNVSAAQLPAFSGDCTSTVGTSALVCTKTNGTAFTAAATAAAGQLPGTSTNDNASAGNVGEYIEGRLGPGSAVSLTSGTPVNVSSITLTAGDWDIWFEPVFSTGSTTTISLTYISISTTSATQNPAIAAFNQMWYSNVVPGTSGFLTPTAGPSRASISTSTTYYGVAQATFGTAGLTVYGVIRARRVR